MVFPITGSGLGVVDAVLIAMLVELGGGSDDALALCSGPGSSLGVQRRT